MGDFLSHGWFGRFFQLCYVVGLERLIHFKWFNYLCLTTKCFLLCSICYVSKMSYIGARMKEMYHVALVVASVQPHAHFMVGGSARESSRPLVSNRDESQGMSYWSSDAKVVGGRSEKKETN